MPQPPVVVSDPPSTGSCEPEPGGPASEEGTRLVPGSTAPLPPAGVWAGTVVTEPPDSVPGVSVGASEGDPSSSHATDIAATATTTTPRTTRLRRTLRAGRGGRATPLGSSLSSALPSTLVMRDSVPECSPCETVVRVVCRGQLSRSWRSPCGGHVPTRGSSGLRTPVGRQETSPPLRRRPRPQPAPPLWRGRGPSIAGGERHLNRTSASLNRASTRSARRPGDSARGRRGHGSRSRGARSTADERIQLTPIRPERSHRSKLPCRPQPNSDHACQVDWSCLLASSTGSDRAS